MLIVCNLSGGGAAFFRDAFIAAQRDKFVWLKYDVESQVYQFIYEYNASSGVSPAVRIPLKLMEQSLFDGLLRSFGISEIFVNHILELPRQVADLITHSSLPYSVFLHDYSYICPTWRLYDDRRQAVCTGNCSAAECAACCHDSELSVNAKKQANLALLQGAAAVIAPSEFVRRRYTAVTGELAWLVRPHYLPWMEGQPRQQPDVSGRVLTLSFIGALTELKGWAVIKKLLAYIRERGLPIRLAVVGFTEEQEDAWQSSDGHLIITGGYAQRELSRILAELHTAAAGVLSIWDETYSYTTTEAILSGYPVLTLSRGAQAERVAKYGCGWVADDIDAVYGFLDYIVSPAGRRDILVRASRTADFVNGAD